MASYTKNGKTQESESQEIAIDIQNLQNASYPINSSLESPLTWRNPVCSSKHKSRLGETSASIESTLEKLNAIARFELVTQKSEVSVPLVLEETPKVKLVPDESEIYRKITDQLRARSFRKNTLKLGVELSIFLLISGLLICSLIIDRFKGKKFIGLEYWRWFVLLLAIFSGLLVTNWVVSVIVFLIEWKFMLKKNVVYFTNGLKENVKVFVWFGVILATWVFVRRDIKRTPKITKAIDLVTWTLVAFVVGAFLWIVKTGLIKLLASSFHLNRYFKRINDSIFQNHVLQVLSGRPLFHVVRNVEGKVGETKSSESVEGKVGETKSSESVEGKVGETKSSESVEGKVGETKSSESVEKEKRKIDWENLQHVKQEKVPSYAMQLLADVIANSGMRTMSDMLNKDVVDGGVELDDDKITSEEEAIAIAYKIFHNVTGNKNPDRKYIDENDLLKFMTPGQLKLIYPLFDIDESGHITLKEFCESVVKIHKDRTALQHAMNDNKTAVNQLNQIVMGILTALMFIFWLLLTEIVNTKILLFLSSQLVVAAFIFGNTCKTIFEAIIFVFVTHPYDIGDRCIIDKTMMVVEEINLLTTVFLKLDKEKVYFPNNVLATKSIGNFYRSPNQGDILKFAIDYKTPLSTIRKLKERIKQYLEQNGSFWQPEHSLIVYEIENLNAITMGLFFNHTMNFQDWKEKTRRRSELVLEMKGIFEELDIQYHLLPQDINLHNMTAKV